MMTRRILLSTRLKYRVVVPAMHRHRVVNGAAKYCRPRPDAYQCNECMHALSSWLTYDQYLYIINSVPMPVLACHWHCGAVAAGASVSPPPTVRDHCETVSTPWPAQCDTS
jgi:hypothetical protein